MTTFVWSTEAQAAFTKLKNALIEASVLAYPDPSYPFLLDTNASNVGIGVMLSQVVELISSGIWFQMNGD